MKKASVLLILTLTVLLCFVSCYFGGTQDPTPEHTHNFGEWSVTKNPTCTEDGVKNRFCDCGEKQSDTIPAKGHEEQILPAKEATCTEKGSTEGTKCSDCGETLVAQQETPLKAHTEEIIPAVESTCTKKGLTEGKKCSVCKIVLIAQQEAPLKAHTEEIIPAVESTCTEKGLTEGKKCSVCKTVLIAQQEAPLKSHSEVVDKAVSATCTTTGLTEGKHCSECGTTIIAQQTIPVIAHTYDDKYDETCNECGFVREAECAHKETLILRGYAATCTSAGLTDGSKCKKCDEVLVAQTVIDALNHTEVQDKAVAATCTSPGLTEGKHCLVCGMVTVEQTVIHTLGHTEVFDSAVEPTCTSTGLTFGLHCSVCGEIIVEQTVLAALGHSYVLMRTEPTCTERGYTTYYCLTCSYSYVDDYVPANEHTEVIDSAVEPTCTSTGLTAGKHCSVCSTVIVAQTVVPAIGHTEVIDSAVIPTCTATGLTEGKHCSVCNVILVTQTVVDALGHNLGEWVVVKEPTLNESGVFYRECANCDLSETRNVQYGKGNSFYGYHYFANEINGTAKQKLYLDLYNICEDFDNSNEDLTDLTLALVDCGTYGLTVDEAIAVWKILLVENPRFYWLSNNITIFDNAIQVNVDKTYIKADYRKECDAAIKSMVADCDKVLNAGMSELEKALAIHNFILNRMNYAYESDGTTPEDAIWAHNMIGCAKYNLGVCESYAEAYMYLCLLNGVDCIIVWGEAGNEDHSWNLVSIDDKWYGVDCTWDETNEDKLSFNCFGMSKSYIESVHTADNCNNIGIDYLYALPEIDERSIELVDLYKEDVFIGTFANIDIAFDKMTDVVGEYSLYLYSYNYVGRLIGDSLTIIEIAPSIVHTIESEAIPKAKEINIYGTNIDLGNGSYTNTRLKINNELISFAEFISINDVSPSGDGILNIQNNCLTIGGFYSWISLPVIGDIENDSSSKILLCTTGMEVEFFDYVQVHTMIGNCIVRNNAKIVDLKTADFLVIGHGDSVEIENLYKEYDLCYIDLWSGANLLIQNLYSSSGRINIDFTFSKVEDYSHLVLGDINCEVNITLNGEMKLTMVDQSGNIVEWYETCSPFDLTEPIVYLMYPEQFEQLKEIIFVKSSRGSDYAHLYEINEENEVVLKNYTLVDDLIIVENVVVYNNGDKKDVVIPETVEAISNNAFFGNEWIESITIPNSVTSIGASAFACCTSLESITIPDSVTSIGAYAFAYCTSLQNVTIGDSVTSIGEGAFRGCTSFTSIIIPNSVTSISRYAFCDCTSLTSVTIGDSVTSIGDHTFYGCRSLTSVTIGESVTSIGAATFEGCTSLQNITFAGTVDQWNVVSLGNCWKDYVPATKIICSDGTVKLY